MSPEEELLNVPFYLEEDESLDFVIGRIEQGDILKISVGSRHFEDVFEVTLSSQEKVLFMTRVGCGGTVAYRVPFSVDAAAIEITYRSPYRRTDGVLRVAVSRSLSRVSRCPACGAPVEPGAKYCWRCGAKLV
jgi:uncharacterized protein with PIN domain